MAISRERKVFGAVLLVAGAGLAVDRGFLGVSGAKPAQASEIAAAPSNGPVIKKVSVTSNQSFASLSMRLKQLGDFPKDADLLAPTLQHAAVVEEPKAKVPERIVEDGRKQFAASHHLTALSTTTRGSNALVNGRAVLIGEEIDGYRLVEVTRGGAIFEGLEGRVELQLPGNR